MTKKDRIRFDSNSENEKLKNTRKQNIKTDAARDQLIIKTERAIVDTRNTVTTRIMKATLIFLDSFKAYHL